MRIMFFVVALTVFTNAFSKDESLKLDGESLKVLSLVLNDFESMSAGFIEQRGNKDILLYKSKIENYNVNIKNYEWGSEVRFRLNPLDGIYFKGGGILYKVDRDAEKIVDKSFSK